MKLIRSVEEIGRYKNLEMVSLADLEALTSIEVVDLKQYIYVVISCQNLPKIGRKVQIGLSVI
jgi:hypothetical protein